MKRGICYQNVCPSVCPLHSSANSPLVVAVVYLPGGDAVDNQFFDELTAVLEQLSAALVT